MDAQVSLFGFLIACYHKSVGILDPKPIKALRVNWFRCIIAYYQGKTQYEALTDESS